MQVKPQEVSADKATTPGQRERFEAAYAAHYNQVRIGSYTAEHIASMRNGDGYGERAYLNGWWEGWKAAEAQQAQLAQALDLAIRSLDQLVPYLAKVPADVGLLNEALMAGRKALQGGAA
jgi:hypothetical protein